MDIFKKLDALRSREPVPTGPPKYLAVGLGNPGKNHENTRHNAGYMALDAAARKAGTKIEAIKFKSYCGEMTAGGKKILLLKPTTYMNLSGTAVLEAMSFHKIPLENVIVFCDDVSFDPGCLRIRTKGSDAGQRGLRDIIFKTGRDDFTRVRLGVGKKPHPDYDLADWVLGKFSPAEQKLLAGTLDSAHDIIKLFAEGKIADAMNIYNRTSSDPAGSGEKKHD